LDNSIGSFYQSIVDKNPTVEYFAPGHEQVDKIIYSLIKEFPAGSFLQAQVNSTSQYEIGIFVVYFQHSRSYKRYKMIVLKDGKTVSEFQLPNFYNIIQVHRQDSYALQEMISLVEIYAKAEAEKMLRRFRTSAEDWQKRLEASHQKTQEKLDEKLELQKSKLKWYGGKQMVSAIHRTINTRQKNFRRHNKKVQFFQSLKEMKIEAELLLFLSASPNLE
ncbi:MAG: hypothetical protein D6767_10040, partial [Candidatus Hydrogenedentota bacterium]